MSSNGKPILQDMHIVLVRIIMQGINLRPDQRAGNIKVHKGTDNGTTNNHDVYQAAS